MGLEVATYIHELVASNPIGASDPKSQGDDHLRLIKSTLQNTFANVDGPVTSSHTELNILDGATLSTAELNILDGVTATATEINILDGVVGVTAGEISFLANVTSDIQTQLNAKLTSSSGLNGSNINSGVVDSAFIDQSLSVSTVTCAGLTQNGGVPATLDSIIITEPGSAGGGGIRLGTAGPHIYAGAGNPNGAVNANIGSLYLRTDGGLGTTLYVKEQAGSTGWTAK